jgi:hypothetical protein
MAGLNNDRYGRGVTQADPEIMLSEISLGRPGQPEGIRMAVKFAIKGDLFIGRVLSVDRGTIF